MYAAPHGRPCGADAARRVGTHSPDGFISVALEPDKYDKFCDFCASQSAIISHYHMVGEFNALLRFAVRDTQQLDQLLSLIKKFGDSRTSIELKTLFDSKEIPLP